MNALRSHFPILSRQVGDKPLVYLDNAATSQKPDCVIERIADYYRHTNANIHRGVHALSQEATDEFEAARRTVAAFIGAADSREVVFTRGATEAVNLLADCLGRTLMKAGDTVLITEMEHHANIVSWQLLRERIGIKLATVRVHDSGELDFQDYLDKLEELRPALVAVVHISNALGVTNPVKDIIEAAHRQQVPVMVDAAQSIPHQVVQVRELDCDWMVFSGHKVLGPTGIGVLYGKYDKLEALPPYQGGGDMIESVQFEKTVFKGPPERFEAGTPNISGAIGLATALEFLNSHDRTMLRNHENALLEAATRGLRSIKGTRIIGDVPNKASVLSFVMEGVHPHDIASFLDAEGIAIRSGHHCAQPLMTRLGLPGTARASFAFYNTFAEVDVFLAGIEKIRRFFA